MLGGGSPGLQGQVGGRGHNQCVLISHSVSKDGVGGGLLNTSYLVICSTWRHRFLAVFW